MKHGWPRVSARIVQVGHGTWAVTVGGRKVSRKPLTGRQALWACVRIFLGYPIGWSLERARKAGPQAVRAAVKSPVGGEQFQIQAAQALAGDVTVAQELPEAAQAFLEASRGVSASRGGET